MRSGKGCAVVLGLYRECIIQARVTAVADQELEELMRCLRERLGTKITKGQTLEMAIHQLLESEKRRKT